MNDVIAEVQVAIHCAIVPIKPVASSVDVTQAEAGATLLEAGALEAALEGALEAALEGALEAALEAALEGALEGALEAALEGALEAALEGALEEGLEARVVVDEHWPMVGVVKVHPSRAFPITFVMRGSTVG